MNDVPTGIVNHAVFEEEASTPDAECANGVGKRQPERDEDHPCGEVHPAEKGSRNQDQCDGREDELEVDHGRLRECLGQGRGGEVGVLEFEAEINGDGWVADEG